MVAARQNAPAPTVDSHTGAGRSAFLTVHDADSVLLKWNGSAFTQVLRGDGHMNFSLWLRRAPDIHGNFTARDVNCTLSPSALGCPSLAGAEWSMAEGLRGATSCIHLRTWTASVPCSRTVCIDPACQIDSAIGTSHVVFCSGTACTNASRRCWPTRTSPSGSGLWRRGSRSGYPDASGSPSHPPAELAALALLLSGAASGALL